MFAYQCRKMKYWPYKKMADLAHGDTQGVTRLTQHTNEEEEDEEDDRLDGVQINEFRDVGPGVEPGEV